jgi:hypothetical protein
MTINFSKIWIQILSRIRTFYRKFRAFVGKGIIIHRTKLVIKDTNVQCHNPIFVIGTHRSGTSLLRRIIDSHPNIACSPESFFLKHYSAILGDVKAFKALYWLGFDSKAVIEGLRTGASYFHEVYRKSKNKVRWADKTPDYVFHLDNLATLFGPDCQFVIIFRHPLDVAFSMWKRGWTLYEYDKNRLRNNCIYVVKSIEAQLAFAECHPEMCHVLFYEDLVTAPELVLKKMCSFLNEPWDEILINYHKADHDFGVEDAQVRGTPGFKPSFENWKEWNAKRLSIALTLLEGTISRLGYSSESIYRKS